MPGRLADNIPERLLNRADRAVELHRATLVGIIVVGQKGKVFDRKGIAASEVTPQLVDVAFNRLIAVGLGIGFAPAVEALVGFDFDKEPILADARIDKKGLKCRDLHMVPRMVWW